MGTSELSEKADEMLRKGGGGGEEGGGERGREGGGESKPQWNGNPLVILRVVAC